MLNLLNQQFLQPSRNPNFYQLPWFMLGFTNCPVIVCSIRSTNSKDFTFPLILHMIVTGITRFSHVSAFRWKNRWWPNGWIYLTLLHCECVVLLLSFVVIYTKLIEISIVFWFFKRTSRIILHMLSKLESYHIFDRNQNYFWYLVETI